jgi:hypothetical protein
VLSLLHVDQQLFIDLKHVNSCRNERVDFERLKVAFEEQLQGYENQVKIICAYEYWLNELATENDVLFSTDDVEEGKKMIQKHPSIKGLVMRNAVIDAQDVTWIKQQNQTVYLYDIRSLKGIRQAYSKNPTGILADDLRNALEERGYAL